jgi:hypothetical protein
MANNREQVIVLRGIRVAMIAQIASARPVRFVQNHTLVR